MKRIVTCVVIAGMFCLFWGSKLHQIAEGGITGLANIDLFAYYHPLLSFSKKTILAGTMPLWDPYQSVGRPFFATFQCGLLYPLNWTIFLFDVAYAMLIVQFMSMMIGIVGMMLYLRHLKIEWAPTMLGAILFGSCVFTQSFNMAMGSSYCWLPFVFWGGHRLVDEPTFRRSVVLAVLLLLCLLGGFPQYFLYTSVLLFVYLSSLILFSRPHSEPRKSILAFCLVGLSFFLTFGLASIQLLPTLELSLNSIRNMTVEFSSISRASTGHSPALVNMAFRPIEYLWKVGSLALLLPFAFASGRRKTVTGALGMSFLYVLVFVYARYIPGLSLLSMLPFADRFRFPSRFLAFGYFAIAALAAIGLSSFWERAPLRLRRAISGRLDWFWIFIIAFTAFLLFPHFHNFLRLLRTSYAYIILLTPALLLAAAMLISKTNYSSRSKSLITLCVALLAILGILIHRDIIFPVVSLFFLILTLPVVLVLLVHSPKFPGWAKGLIIWIIAVSLSIGVSRSGNTLLSTSVPAFHRVGFDDVKYMEWATENAGYDRVSIPIRNPKNASVFGFFSVDDYEPFTLARWHNFIRKTVGSERFDSRFSYLYHFYGDVSGYPADVYRSPQMMGLASLRYLATPTSLEVADLGWTLCYENGNGNEDDDSTFYVYENRFSLPRAYLVNDYIISHSEQESLKAIEENIERLRHSVVLENGLPSFPRSQRPESPGKARIEKYGINEVQIRVDSPHPSLLVLTDSYFPGWEAQVDGMEKPIWRANSLFRAVEVPAGNHSVIFEYHPASLRWGAAISLITLLLILTGLLVERHYTRRRSGV